MELIERYLQEVGRALPRKQRADILSELRSSLYDSLESGPGDEQAAAAAIKKMGSPHQVAASYYPQGQYLIGPALFPLFRMVAGIVVAAVVGAQILAALLGLVFSPNPALGTENLFGFAEALWSIVYSLPVALGWVVVVFWILQRYEVQPETESEFDPTKLPPLEPPAEQVSRVSQVVSILFGVLFLALFSRFAQPGGLAWFAGSGFLENPVITRYFPWIAASMAAGIILDIVLLWRGRWHVSTRIAAVVAGAFSLAVLLVLVQAHQAWLADAGVKQLSDGFAQIRALADNRTQVVGMAMFHMALLIAAIVVAVDTAVQVYQLVRALMGRTTPGNQAVPA